MYPQGILWVLSHQKDNTSLRDSHDLSMSSGPKLSTNSLLGKQSNHLLLPLQGCFGMCQLDTRWIESFRDNRIPLGKAQGLLFQHHIQIRQDTPSNHSLTLHQKSWHMCSLGMRVAQFLQPCNNGQAHTDQQAVCKYLPMYCLKV